MDSLGIGLAGVGRWGRNYLDTLIGIPDCRVVAAADPDPAVRSSVKHRYAIPVFPDLTDLLACNSLSAVVIATPDRTHFQLACQSLEAGKNVLVEKPMTTDSSCAASLARLAETCKLVLAVGHTTLYHPEFCALRTAVKQGKAGRPLQVVTVRTSNGPANGQTDVLWDLAPHDLAMTISMFGTPTAVHARFQEQDRSAAGFELLFADETRVRGTLAWRPGSSVRRFSIVGPRTSLTWEDKPDLAENPAERPLTRLCRDFITCCLKHTTPHSSAEMGLAVTRCLDMMSESARHNGSWLPVAEPACC